MWLQDVVRSVPARIANGRGKRLGERFNMTEQNADFSGWAKVELMGRNVLVGYVTTRYFGPAALFQVDIPGSEECDEMLVDPEFVDGKWCPTGSIVKRPAIPSASPMVGPTTIYRLTPCTEEVARKALAERHQRAIAIVSVPNGYNQLSAPIGSAEGLMDYRQMKRLKPPKLAMTRNFKTKSEKSKDEARGALQVWKNTAGYGGRLTRGIPDGLAKPTTATQESGKSMLASRRWRDWNPPAIFQECPERELTKPTEPLPSPNLSVLSVPSLPVSEPK